MLFIRLAGNNSFGADLEQWSHTLVCRTGKGGFVNSDEGAGIELILKTGVCNTKVGEDQTVTQ